MYSWRDREIVMDLLQALTGNRVNYGFNTIGGVRKDITEEQKQDILAALKPLEERTKYYAEIAGQELTLIKRLKDVGRLSKEDVIRLGVTGPTARASGVKRDVRKDDPYAIYAQLDFEVITAETCDVYGRTLVRVGELFQTFKMIHQILTELPDGPITAKAPRKIPKGQAISRYEAPRGEDFHFVRGNGTDKPERVKVRAPTLVNLQAVSLMMKGGYLADMPITLAAIDPCFSCTDRMIELRDDSGSHQATHSWSELRELGIRTYKARGIEFSELGKRLTTKLERVSP
jgi:NADH-quinone oxidoreductase subunit D